MNNFIDRKQELIVLNNYYDKESVLILINGAHNVGKTELIKKFIQDKPSIYFSAGEFDDELNRQIFLNALKNHYPNTINSSNSTPNWENLFRVLVNGKNKEQEILVLDNFDNLLQGNPDFIPEFLKIWKNILKPNNITVIFALPNNSILVNLEKHQQTFMKALNLRLQLKPIPFFELMHNYPDKQFAELVSIYNITGGFPLYWDFFIQSKTVMEQFLVVDNEMNKSNGFFYDLPINLLQKNVWDTKSYITVLFYLANGVNTFPELLKKSNLKKNQLIKYLANLEILGYVRAEKSIFTKRNNLKNNHFFIDNELFRFWFHFIYPNRTFLNPKIFQRQLIEEYPDYIEETFKSISFDMLKAAIAQKSLEFQISKIGTFWNKNSKIPIVAIDNDNKQLFLGDTQFSLKDYNLESFINFIKETLTLKELRKFKDYKKIYGLFTANTPSEDLIRYALNNEDTIIFSGTKLIKKK